MLKSKRELTIRIKILLDYFLLCIQKMHENFNFSFFDYSIHYLIPYFKNNERMTDKRYVNVEKLL